jgi:ankyrin repeat protein
VGADVNLRGRRGNTPLISACEGGHVSVVKELVKGEADVNLQGRRGNTPLIAACEGGHVSVVEELVKAGTDVNLKGRKGDTPLITAVRYGSLSTVRSLVGHGADWVTQIVDTNVSAIYTALMLNKLDVMKYLIKEQNKINPCKYHGNSLLFNCLVDIKHARVTTDSKDDVVVADDAVWCMDWQGSIWETLNEGDCDVLRHLLSVGLDANQSVQLYDSEAKYDSDKYSDARPLLCTLNDEEYANDRTEKVGILLGAGADVNVRVKYKEYKYVLDKNGVSVLERTRRLMCKYSESEDVYISEIVAPECKRVMCEIKKRVRRHSV